MDFSKNSSGIITVNRILEKEKFVIEEQLNIAMIKYSVYPQFPTENRLMYWNGK